jgi:hypothetical protein
VDESGTHVSMDRLRSRAPRGERAYGKVPKNRGKNTTLIASMSLHRMGESMCIEGATDAAAFEVYIEHFLAPSLCEGQVVVMDNLGAHQPKRIRELIEARGAEVVFLPSFPALLLSGPEPHRASVLQDKEHPEKARSAHPRSSTGGDGRGAL